jgi:hypothetical protein
VETPAHRPKLVPVAVVIFGIGLVALAAIFVLFASGRHDLPLWLNTSAGVLVPLGFGLALIGLVREARRDSKRKNSPAQLPSVAEDSASQSANPVKSDSTSSAPAARS